MALRVSRRTFLGMLGGVPLGSVLAACTMAPVASTPMAAPTAGPSIAARATEPPVSRFAVSEGFRIHYEVEGRGSPLLLVHGFGGNLGMWHTNGYVDALRDEHQLFLIDARGHGQSDRPGESNPLTVEAMAQDMVAILDDAGLERGNYMGQSMGGRVGWQLAATAPDRLGSLVTAAASPYGHRTEALKKTFAFVPPALRDWPGIGDSVEKLPMPCLLIDGQLDPVYEDAKERPGSPALPSSPSRARATGASWTRRMSSFRGSSSSSPWQRCRAWSTSVEGRHLTRFLSCDEIPGQAPRADGRTPPRLKTSTNPRRKSPIGDWRDAIDQEHLSGQRHH